VGRLFLILILLAVCVAIVIILVSASNEMYKSGQRALRPMFGTNDGGPMAPSGYQKVAYIALIVLLFGVTSGWLGGL